MLAYIIDSCLVYDFVEQEIVFQYPCQDVEDKIWIDSLILSLFFTPFLLWFYSTLYLPY